MGNRIFSICYLLTISILPLSFCPCFSQFVGYRCDIYFQSTSDWATLRFPNANVFAIDMTVVIDSSGSAHIGELSIVKPDTKMVAVIYNCVILDIPDTGVEMISCKGDWGNVLIRVTNTNNTMPPYPVMEFENFGSVPGDPTNRRDFLIPHDFLAEGGPITIPLDPWETPKYFMAFYYPWYGSPAGPTGYWFHWDPAIIIRHMNQF